MSWSKSAARRDGSPKPGRAASHGWHSRLRESAAASSVSRCAGRRYRSSSAQALELLGAIGPSLVAWFVVLPLHGLPPAGGWNPQVIVSALLVNAAWGLGYGLLMRRLS